MFVIGPFSFVFVAIILLGAYKCWMGVTHVLSKLFHQYEEPHIKMGAAIVVGVTIMLMVAPLLIPAPVYLRDIVGVLYVIYAGTAIYQIYHFWQHLTGKDKPSSTTKPNDKNGK